MNQPTKAVLIFEAAGLVLAASNIDNHASTCGSRRAGSILRKIADKIRDDAVALRKRADAMSPAHLNTPIE